MSIDRWYDKLQSFMNIADNAKSFVIRVDKRGQSGSVSSGTIAIECLEEVLLAIDSMYLEGLPLHLWNKEMRTITIVDRSEVSSIHLTFYCSQQ